MTHAARRTRSAACGVRCPGARVGSRAEVVIGTAVVAAALCRGEAPTGSVRWARSARRFGRAAVWALPGYAVASGLATFGGPTAPRLAADAGLLPPAGPVPAPLAVAALWLGLVAAVALAAVLAAASSRRLATGGLLTVLAGTVVLLPLSAVPADAPAYGTTAGRLVLAGATLHTAGWVLLGWAVARCRLLDRGDGVLLMMAAPMIGVAGHLMGPLQTVGALLLLAGGMGVARRAGRLAPPDRYRLDPFAPPIMD